MSMQMIGTTIEKIFAADLVYGPLTVIWHAGEPLAVPLSYYDQARITGTAVAARRRTNIMKTEASLRRKRCFAVTA